MYKYLVKEEQIQNLPNCSFDKSLQGLVSGLLVTQGTGQPGGGVSNFVLRGIATGKMQLFARFLCLLGRLLRNSYFWIARAAD